MMRFGARQDERVWLPIFGREVEAMHVISPVILSEVSLKRNEVEESRWIIRRVTLWNSLQGNTTGFLDCARNDK